MPDDLSSHYRPEDYKKAHERIKHLWMEGAVAFGHHAREQMSKRDVTTADLEHLIRFGQVVEHSRPRGAWRYTLEGLDADGRRIRCCVEMDETLFVVTTVRVQR